MRNFLNEAGDLNISFFDLNMTNHEKIDDYTIVSKILPLTLTGYIITKKGAIKLLK